MFQIYDLSCCEDGSTSVEFSIVLPVFLFIIMGIMEFSQASYLLNKMNHVADMAERRILIGQVDVWSDTQRKEFEECIKQNFPKSNVNVSKPEERLLKDSNEKIAVVTLNLHYDYEATFFGEMTKSFLLDVTRAIPVKIIREQNFIC